MNGPLEKDEHLRYSRHLVLPEVGIAGQEKLKAGSVLLVGAGGLGSPLALYLAAAGVGRIGIADFDKVDLSNLQRQVLHDTSAVGRRKTESAKERLARINPHVRIDTFEERLTSANALSILKGYDVVADGTDNFPTRYLVNDACVLLDIPNVYGSVFRFEGQASVFHYRGGPCYRCLYPEPPPPGMVPSCAEGGVLGVLPGLIGMVQATETIKILLGKGETLSGRLLLYDALGMSFRTMKLRRNRACSVCGDSPEVTALVDYEELCGGGRDDDPDSGEAPGESPAPPREMTVGELKNRLDSGDRTFLLLDVREPYEREISELPGSTLIPMNEIPDRLGELDGHAEIVCYCRTGIRSARVVEYLSRLGFRKTWNLAGGINRWAREIDPNLPEY